MARIRGHLRNAPIGEALIDFRVLRRELISADVFSGLGALVGQRYSQSRVMQSVRARFGIDQGQMVEPSSTQAAVGWIYIAEGAVAQFRVDGFTFNKLEPYTTWEQVFGEAIRLWAVYVTASAPTEVTRLAVRYINRMRVPGPANLQDYLTAPPALPPEISPRVQEFLSRVVVQDSTRDASVILVQALESSLDPSLIPLLLDIDAFKAVSLPPEDPSLPRVFEQLRMLKNEVFYASITERTVEMYE